MSLSIYHTHTHLLGHKSERRSCWDKRETTAVGRSSYYFWGFAFGANSISEEVSGFSPLWFPRGKSLCLLCLVFIVVHVILSVKDPKIIMLA